VFVVGWQLCICQRFRYLNQQKDRLPQQIQARETQLLGILSTMPARTTNVA
jgi:hypothetical protein